ncbi:MAG: hypothetical protein QM765_33600 [Myxococcales bacterium]
MDFLSPIVGRTRGRLAAARLADWLQERADPRGEFIVASCRLAQLDQASTNSVGEHLRYEQRRASL